VKDWGLGRTFLRSLQIGQRLPGGLARRVGQKKCGATAALTNVGEVLRDSQLPRVGDKLIAGNLQLQTVDFPGPHPTADLRIFFRVYLCRLSFDLLAV
jgi:hypothetical protein